jgi:hypothetical protein
VIRAWTASYAANIWEYLGIFLLRAHPCTEGDDWAIKGMDHSRYVYYCVLVDVYVGACFGVIRVESVRTVLQCESFTIQVQMGVPISTGVPLLVGLAPDRITNITALHEYVL